jgi:hypothetical protein
MSGRPSQNGTGSKYPTGTQEEGKHFLGSEGGCYRLPVTGCTKSCFAKSPKNVRRTFLRVSGAGRFGATGNR